MKWRTLPGPARFIDDVLHHLRNGSSVVVALPVLAPTELEDVFVDALEHDRWRLNRVIVEEHEDPLHGLTEQLYLEPEQWVGWSVEKMFEQLSPGQVITVQGISASNWDQWRILLRDYEVASRRAPADERAVLLVFVRGIPRKRLQTKGAALELVEWRGVIGELEILMYADHRLRQLRQPSRHHKLIIRQIAALALWDLDLADFLLGQPEHEMFDVQAVLQAGRQLLGRNGVPTSAAWEHGGSDQFDGVEMQHPFVLIDQGDPEDELKRRSWTAQAAELLPQIELRRRALAKALERYVPCPFWIYQKDFRQRQSPTQVLVRSLDELEIGSLAFVARNECSHRELCDRAEWLANCRNELAHLKLLKAIDALDPRMYA
jgi:hypothetical protein